MRLWKLLLAAGLVVATVPVSSAGSGSDPVHRGGIRGRAEAGQAYPCPDYRELEPGLRQTTSDCWLAPGQSRASRT